MASPLLSCDSLSIRFGGLLAVDGLSFSVMPGAIHGLIGPNGAGKTTVFNLISGYYKPDSGQVLFKNENIAGLKTHAIAARGVVRTFQHASLFNELTVLDNVLIGSYLHHRPTLRESILAGANARSRGNMQAAEDILAFFGLMARRHDYASSLPHGMQRMLGIAVAMAAQPQLLLLDEPFTGMNPEETRQMMRLTRQLQARGITLLLVEHDMRAVMGLCDFITVINFGQVLAEGSAEEIANHPQVIEAYLGSSAVQPPC